MIFEVEIIGQLAEHWSSMHETQFSAQYHTHTQKYFLVDFLKKLMYFVYIEYNLSFQWTIWMSKLREESFKYITRSKEIVSTPSSNSAFPCYCHAASCLYKVMDAILIPAIQSAMLPAYFLESLSIFAKDSPIIQGIFLIDGRVF